MVVRGDSGFVLEGLARQTILSGPAASIVGAKWMTGVEDSLA